MLDGSPEQRCPECGLAFDPNNPATFTYKPPFLRWTFWAPAMLLVVAVAVLLLLYCLIPMAGFGVATTLAAPISLGAVVGYGFRVRKLVLALLIVVGAVGVVSGLVAMDVLGAFCAMTMGIVLLSPLLLGMLLGFLLRHRLKSSSFSQRFHLPTFLVLLFIAIPVLVAWGEKRWKGPATIEQVSTSIDMPVSLPRAWDGVVFYENVDHEPPFLLRHILPHPLYARGSMAHVGDLTVCVYRKGRLIKKITRREPGKLLAFDVVSQQHIENRSIRLIDGSFAFERLDEGHTRVTVTTRYEPLLTPRWIWRPFELLATHELHGHVLEGMRRKADAASRALALGERDPFALTSVEPGE